MVAPIKRTSFGGNRDLVDDAYGVSTVTMGKFCTTKLLQFGLKGNCAKMGLVLAFLGVGVGAGWPWANASRGQTLIGLRQCGSVGHTGYDQDSRAFVKKSKSNRGLEFCFSFDRIPTSVSFFRWCPFDSSTKL